MAVPRITVHGKVADMQTHEFANGGLMVRLRVVTNDRRKNAETGEWEDADTWWGTVKVLSDRLARNVAESTRKGDIITVMGRLRSVKFTDDSGNERSVDEVIADDVAASHAFRKLRHGEAAPENPAPSPGWAATPAPTDPWAAEYAPTSGGA
jgi:single-strand DNA-binding protein